MYTDILAQNDDNMIGEAQERSAWDRLSSKIFRYRGRNADDVYPLIEELYTMAIIQILNIVSSTLRSLLISVRTCGAMVALYGVPGLPVLEELTLAYESEHIPKLPTWLLGSFCRLPSLRRLDLSQFFRQQLRPSLRCSPDHAYSSLSNQLMYLIRPEPG
jgi:hypothetical protein